MDVRLFRPFNCHICKRDSHCFNKFKMHVNRHKKFLVWWRKRSCFSFHSSGLKQEWIDHTCNRDVRVQLLSWFQCFLLPAFMRILLFSAQNLHFYFNFALLFSVFGNFQSFLSVASHIPGKGTCNITWLELHNRWSSLVFKATGQRKVPRNQ